MSSGVDLNWRTNPSLRCAISLCAKASILGEGAAQQRRAQWLLGAVVDEIIRQGYRCPRMHDVVVTARDGMSACALVDAGRDAAWVVIDALLMDRCSDEEVKGIIAHEFGHVVAGDLPSPRLIVEAGVALSGLPVALLGVAASTPAHVPMAAMAGALLLALWVIARMPEFIHAPEFTADAFSARISGKASIIRALYRVEAFAHRQREGSVRGRAASWLRDRVRDHPATWRRVSRIRSL